MEIVLAVLLLFGGFTLGSITADKGDDASQAAVVLPSASGIPDSYPLTQAMHQSDLTRCQSDGVVIYRDLTVPYRAQAGEQASQADDGDQGCSDD
jgi:hypothetical protein